MTIRRVQDQSVTRTLKVIFSAAGLRFQPLKISATSVGARR